MVALLYLLLLAPVGGRVIELLDEPRYVATRGLCDNFTNTVGLKIPSHFTLPIDKDWSVGLRVKVDPTGTGHYVEEGSGSSSPSWGRQLDDEPADEACASL